MRYQRSEHAWGDKRLLCLNGSYASASIDTRSIQIALDAACLCTGYLGGGGGGGGGKGGVILFSLCISV